MSRKQSTGGNALEGAKPACAIILQGQMPYFALLKNIKRILQVNISSEGAKPWTNLFFEGAVPPAGMCLVSRGFLLK